MGSLPINRRGSARSSVSTECEKTLRELLRRARRWCVWWRRTLPGMNTGTIVATAERGGLRKGLIYPQEGSIVSRSRLLVRWLVSS